MRIDALEKQVPLSPSLFFSSFFTMHKTSHQKTNNGIGIDCLAVTDSHNLANLPARYQAFSPNLTHQSVLMTLFYFNISSSTLGILALKVLGKPLKEEKLNGWIYIC